MGSTSFYKNALFYRDVPYNLFDEPNMVTPKVKGIME